MSTPGPHDLITSYRVYRAVLIVIMSSIMLGVGYELLSEIVDFLTRWSLQ